MNKLKPIFTLIIAFLTIIALAQEDFKRGYIINNNHDTIYGLIKHQELSKRFYNCIFKVNEGDTIKTYFPFQIIAYKFEDDKFYVSKKFEIDSVPKNIFAEFLFSGKTNLFYLQENYKDHYYIEKSGEKTIELTKKTRIVIIDDKEFIKESKQYIGILKYYFADCPEILSDIENSELTNKSLINLSKEYHEKTCVPGTPCIIYEKKLNPISFWVSPVIGYALSVHTSVNYSPLIGISLGIRNGPLGENITVELQGEYKNYYFYTFQKELKNSNYEINTYDHIYYKCLKYRLLFNYSKSYETIRPYFVFGLSYKTTISSEGSKVITESVSKDLNRNISTVETVYEENDKPFENIPGIVFGYGVSKYINPNLALKIDMTCELQEILDISLRTSILF